MKNMFIKLKKWLSGDIGWQEEKALRKAASEDPFIADAIDGFEQFPESNHTEKIHQLNKRIRKRTAPARKMPTRAIAATLLFLVTGGLFWFVNQTAFTSAESELAHQPTMEKSVPALEVPLPEAPISKIREDVSSVSTFQDRPTSTKSESNQQPKQETAKKERSRKIVSQSRIRPKSEAAEEVEETIADQSTLLPEEEEQVSTTKYETDASAIAQMKDDTALNSYTAYQEAELASSAIKAPISRATYNPEQQILQYLQSNLQYPEAAISNEIRGVVRLEYQVNKRGKLRDVKVLNGLGYGCDKEAIRLLKGIPFLMPSHKDTLTIQFDY